MTKRDYELVAQVVRETTQEISTMGVDENRRWLYGAGLRLFTYNLAIKLLESNPRFNANTFIEACD